jgi:hypothetical protein
LSENCPQRKNYLVIEDIRKNLFAKLNAVSLGTSDEFERCKNHVTVKGDYFEEIQQFKSYFLCISVLVVRVL